MPQDYVPTPGGYSHPSCVIEVREGEWIRGEFIVAPDGTARSVGRCGYPQLDRRGVLRAPATPGPVASGYLVEVHDTGTGPLDWLSATWTVPSPPASVAGQTIYLFPSLSPLAGGVIIQPVLAWNGLGAGSGWHIYSWYYDNANTQHQFYSTPYAVAAGETISGYMAGTDCNAVTRVCNTWQIRTASTNSSSTLTTQSFGVVFDWPFAAALEVYAVSTCAQFPASGSVTFQNLSAHALGGVNVWPLWRVSQFPSSPSCVTGASGAGSTASITWCVPVSSCGGRVCGPLADGCGGTLDCGTCRGSGRKCMLPDKTWFFSGQYCTESGTCAANPCTGY